MTVTPYYAPGTRDGMRACFRRYRDALDLPALLYQIPRRSCIALAGSSKPVEQRASPRAVGFAIEGGSLGAVATDDGGLPCDRAIIAAGIGSAALARLARDRVPLIAERGYHVVIPDPSLGIRAGLMPSDGQMGVVSTPQGLRLAGPVELAAPTAAPDWRRAEILLGYARKMFPELAPRFDAASVDRWMGNRPSTPDGLPCIGLASASTDIVHAFGHAHTGLTQAPATAELVAALIGAHEPPFDPAPYAARRFAR